MGKDHDLAKEMTRSVSRPPQLYKTADDVLRSPEGNPYPFNRMFLKLVAAMRGRSVEDYIELASGQPFPFHRNSDYFKLNLFPVAFQKVSAALWDKHYRKATGLSSRSEYIQWCRENRFPAVRSWVRRGRPRLIVSVGLSEVENFKEAFGIKGQEHEEIIDRRRLAWFADETTLAAVVPFPTSPSGLNSNQAIQAFGDRLAEIMKPTSRTGTGSSSGPPARTGSDRPLTVSMSKASDSLSASDGWNQTYSNPQAGKQTEFIERALSDNPRTPEELAEIANLIADLDDYVKPKRVTQHLTYHHESLGGAERQAWSAKPDTTDPTLEWPLVLTEVNEAS